MKQTLQLESEKDLVFQRREWLVQRFGWWVLAAFVGAAVMGLFGGGPLSTARAGATDGPLWIEYERFVRIGASTRISIHASTTASADDLRVRMRRGYFETLRIDSIVPEPKAVVIGDEDVSLIFSAAGTLPGPFTVILDVQLLRPGRHAAAFGLDGTASETFVQFAYF